MKVRLITRGSLYTVYMQVKEQGELVHLRRVSREPLGDLGAVQEVEVGTLPEGYRWERVGTVPGGKSWDLVCTVPVDENVPHEGSRICAVGLMWYLRGKDGSFQQSTGISCFENEYGKSMFFTLQVI